MHSKTSKIERHYRKSIPQNLEKESASVKCPIKHERPRTKCRLDSSILYELWSIWKTHPRVPSVESRRAWANSRSAAPNLVDNWFLRRKACAKKAGESILQGPYELSLEPRIAQEPKVQRARLSSTPAEPDIIDPPSDDTLANPEGHDHDLDHAEASSDTALDAEPITEDLLSSPSNPKQNERRAYTEVLVPSRIKYLEDNHLLPESSSASIHPPSEAEDLPNQHVPPPVFNGSSFQVCNQGQKRLSNFTCTFCSSKSVQGAPYSGLFAPGTTASLITSTWFARPEFARLDLSPDTSMELSAIPFLFRTPSAVHADTPFGDRTTADGWMSIEEELGELVTEHKLDFSHLGSPDLPP